MSGGDAIGTVHRGPMGKVMAAVGLKEVDTYVLHLHNNMAQYITTSPILELCLAEEWRPVAHVSQWW